MRKVIFVCVVLLLCVSPGLGCLTTPPAATGGAAAGPTITDRITILETWKTGVESISGGLPTFLTALKTALDKKAERAEVDALSSRVNSMNVSGSFNSANYYTKTEVDAAIAALKSNQSWITGSSNNPGTGSTISGGLAIRVYSMNPATVYTAGDYDIFLEINNTTGGVQKCILKGDLIASGFAANVDVTSTSITANSAYLTGALGVSFSPTTGTACQIISCTSSQILVASNTKIVVPVKLHLIYQASPGTLGIWSMTWAVTQIP